MTQRSLVTSSTLLCLLAVLACPCQAQQIYACVSASDGTLRIVQPSPNPPTCKKNETLLSWNQVGPQGPQGPAGATGPAGPQGLPGESASPIDIAVHCGTPGETVAAALAQGMNRAGRLTITIAGVCEESVNVERDNVILVGTSSGDGLKAPNSNTRPLGIIGAQRVTLRQLTLQGGDVGILVQDGASVRGENVRIVGAGNGLVLWMGSVYMINSTIEGSVRTNINVSPGGQLMLWSSTVRNGGFHGVDITGGSAWLWQATIEGNKGSGLIAMNGAHLNVDSSDIVGNTASGIAMRGSHLELGNSRVAHNDGGGIGMAGGMVNMTGATIEDNSMVGVNATLGSRIHIESNTVIQRNKYFGIWMGDTSVLFGGSESGIQITANDGMGVFCDSAPAVAHITPRYTDNGPVFSINESHVFGNSGPYQINCPGIVVPSSTVK